MATLRPLSSATKGGRPRQGWKGVDHVDHASVLSSIEKRMSAMESELRKLRASSASAQLPQPSATAPITAPFSIASALGKAIFKFVQLEKAALTWSRALPPTVGKSKDKVFDDITPPMPVSTFRHDLDQSKAQTRVATQRLVMEHLERQSAASQALFVKPPSLCVNQQHS